MVERKKMYDEKEILTDDIEELKIGGKSSQIIKEIFHKSSDERYQVGDNTERQAD